MTCNRDCQQGRKCDCSKDASIDRATVVIATLILICIVSIGFGLYKLMNRNKGEECAVTLQFNNNVKATYIGRTV
jgi:hypothetical protein